MSLGRSSKKLLLFLLSFSATCLLFVPTPLEGGGGGTIYSNGFFVQTILADRYIHRRGL